MDGNWYKNLQYLAASSKNYNKVHCVVYKVGLVVASNLRLFGENITLSSGLKRIIIMRFLCGSGGTEVYF